MNPRDLPEVVAELIIEMHEVRSELRGLNGRVDRLEQTMAQVLEEQRGLREEMHGMREDMHGMREGMHGMREDMHGMREEMHGMREDMQTMPERIGTAVIKSLEPFLNRLLDHDEQLKNHEGRLNKLENPQ